MKKKMKKRLRLAQKRVEFLSKFGLQISIYAENIDRIRHVAYGSDSYLGCKVAHIHDGNGELLFILHGESIEKIKKSLKKIRSEAEALLSVN